MGQSESTTAGVGPVKVAAASTGSPAPPPLKPPLDAQTWARLTEAMHYLECRGAYEHEGVYRVPGLGTRVAQLVRILTAPSPSTEPSTPLDFPSIPAGLDEWASAIKQSFNKFAPLTGYDSYDPLVAAAATNCLPTLLTMVSALDPVSLERVDVVCRHLVRIALRSHKNKMTISNLAKLWGGILVRPDEALATDLGRELKVAGRQFQFANALLEAYFAQESTSLLAEAGDSSSADGSDSSVIGLLPDAPPPLSVFRIRRSSFAPDQVADLFSSGSGGPAAVPSPATGAEALEPAAPIAPASPANDTGIVAIVGEKARPRVVVAPAARRNIPALRLAPPSTPSSLASAPATASGPLSAEAALSSPSLASTSADHPPLKPSLSAAAANEVGSSLPLPYSPSGRKLQTRLSVALSARGSRLASPLVISRIDADALAGLVEAISLERSSSSRSAASQKQMALRQQQSQYQAAGDEAEGNTHKATHHHHQQARASNQPRFFPATLARARRTSGVKEEEGEEEEEEDGARNESGQTNAGSGAAAAKEEAEEDVEASLAAWEANAAAGAATASSSSSGRASISGQKRPSLMQKLGARFLLRRAASAASSKELMMPSAPAPSASQRLDAASNGAGLSSPGRAGGRFDASALSAALAAGDASGSGSATAVTAAAPSSSSARPLALAARPSIQSMPVFSSPSSVFGQQAQASDSFASGDDGSLLAPPLHPHPHPHHVKVLVESRPSLAPGLNLGIGMEAGAPISSAAGAAGPGPSSNIAVAAARAAVPSNFRRNIPSVSGVASGR